MIDFRRTAWAALLVAIPAMGQQALPLQDYLGQVKLKNQAFQGAGVQAKGSNGLVREADLLLLPKLSFEASRGFDEKVQRQSSFLYDRVNTSSYSLGLTQKTSIGLEAKFTYFITDNRIKGLQYQNSTVDASMVDGSAQLELTMPLWGNGFGRTVRANQEVIRHQANANKQNALAQSASILVNAESAYWRLAAASDQLNVEEQTLKAAQNIQSYVRNKRQKDLGETADVLQADALVEAYNLRVQQAQTELRSAQREFNLYLNQEATDPTPALESLKYDLLEQIDVPKQRPGDRPDVKASEAQAQLAKASSVLAEERNKPTLDLYGSYTAYGQDSEISKAMDQTGRFDRDGAYVGIRFSVPLGLSALAEAKDGARQTLIAAEKNLGYLRYSQEQQWTDITQKLSDAKQSLKLATAMEKAQKAKLDNERSRLRQGRTTTYQVLLFEQDYNNAQASRVQVASRILALNSQLKLYQETLEGGK